MPKILLVANTDWYLYNYRLSLARFLRQEGHEVVLVSPPGRFVALLEQEGFRWVAWHLGRQTTGPWTEWAAWRHLLNLYRQEHPDLVHHHTIKPVLYGTLAARFSRVPAIVNSITGLGYIFVRNELKARCLRLLTRPLYRLALASSHCAVIFENVSDREYFLSKRLISSQRAWLIEGVGVDVDYFVPLPRPEGKPTVVLAARLLWDKGVGEFVDAARILQGKDIRFVLVGIPDPGNPSSIPESELRAWSESGLVEWWGWRDDMRQVYQDCHVVTLPSYGEGVPIALLEAAACQRPLVATDVPGCRDVIQNGVNGFLVPEKNAAALAEAFYRLAIAPDLCDQMGAAGRQLVMEKFTVAQVNAQTLQVYRHFL